MLTLDSHDRRLVARVQSAMEDAIATAHVPVVVTKRIAVLSMRYRNRGRTAAIKRHPFKGVCEASGRPLDRKHAHLDELEPEKGYRGRVRWLCPRANNSGTHSCGGC